MKLKLIAPAWRESRTGKIKRFSFFPPLSLGILASLTPDDMEVSLIDENLQKIDFQEKVDLVAITTMTAAAPRAYEIAEKFRANGAKVVLGGIHPSAVPQEAANYADAVCIGEAEDYWPELIEDFKRGQLKKFYRAGERKKFLTIPRPKRSLFPTRGYLTHITMQTTRGCPFACDFCSVTNFFGRTYRFCPIPDIISELRDLKAKLVAFVDDNIVGNFKRAKEFFSELIPLKLKWYSQASINISRDDELLELARKSGCIGLFIGLESLSSENLEAVGKKVNVVEKFEQAIEKIHYYGLAIQGAFIFGLDGDDKSVFKQTVEFAKKMKLEAVQFGILTPFPGTPLYDQMEKEGRIFDRNWAHYDIGHAVFEPRHMSPATLRQGFEWAWKEFYSTRSILQRLGLLRKNLEFLLALNFAYHRGVRHFSHVPV